MIANLFADFNAAVERARADYHLSPNRACGIPNCPALSADASLWCGIHRRPGMRWRWLNSFGEEWPDVTVHTLDLCGIRCECGEAS